MKQVLVVSIALLVVTVALRYVPLSPADGVRASQSTPGAEITLVSAGRGFDKASIGPLRFGAAMLVNDCLFQCDRSKDGLWVAALSPLGVIGTPRCYALGRSGADVADFTETCAGLPSGTILVLSVSRSIALEGAYGDAVRGVLVATFASLGARWAPLDTDQASWGYVCIRKERGWAPLGEGLSTRRGLRLDLKCDPSAASSPVYVYDVTGPERRNVHLLDYITDPAQVPAGTRWDKAKHLGTGFFDSVLVPLAHGDGGGAVTLVKWPEVHLGTDSRFQAHIRCSDGKSTAERLSLALLLGEERVPMQMADGQPARTGWELWQADLPVAMSSPGEVSLEATAEAPGYELIIGDPIVSYAPIAQ